MTFDSAPTRIWSSASTNTALFLPFTGPLATRDLGGARMGVELRSTVGPLEVLPAFVRYNDPNAAFPAYLALSSAGTPTWFADTGWTWMDEFRDLTSLLAAYRFATFGLAARNTTGSARNLAMASVRLEWFGRGP
jgi:hypothetical protein